MKMFFKNFVIVILFTISIISFSSCNLNFNPEVNTKIGIVSDFYLSSGNEEALLSFKKILKTYKKNGVKTLIFGGNMISGESNADYDILSNAISSVYSTEKPEIIYAMGESEWLIKTGLSDNEAKNLYLEFTNREDNNFLIQTDAFNIICISGEDVSQNISSELYGKIETYINQCNYTNEPVFVVFNTENCTSFEETQIYNILSAYDNIVLIDGKANSCMYNSRNITQKNFSTINCGIADSESVINELNDFYGGKQILIENEYQKQYYGLQITAFETQCKIKRITDSNSTDIQSIKTEKINYTQNNIEKNIITGTVNYNYVEDNGSVTLRVALDTKVQTICETYKLTLNNSEYYIINLKYSKTFNFDKVFYNLPVGNYEVSISAIDFFGNESEQKLYANTINTELILPLSEGNNVNEDNDLLHNLEQSSDNITTEISDDFVSVNSLQALKITGTATENNYPYIILRPEGYYDLNNKKLSIDGYFENAVFRLCIFLTFSNDETISLAMTFNADTENYVTSELDLSEYFEIMNFSEIKEIKIIFNFDTTSNLENSGISTVYLDNIKII